MTTMPAGFFTEDNAFMLSAMAIGTLAEQRGEKR
jgi:hypothetical protein